jgi:rubrerythrin
MPPFASVEEVLNFAIVREEEAARFYTDYAGKAKHEEMRKTFLEFALEETSHKLKLMAIRDGRTLLPAQQKIADLRIAEMQSPVKPDNALSYGEVLILAMQREKASFKLYTELAAAAPDENLRKTFEILAQEEAKHKLRFELEYDREELSEN